MMKHDATNVQIPGEFNDDADFWEHEICKNYEANRLGIVRNIKSKKEVGKLEKNGYIRFSCRCCGKNGKLKNYLNHRFIYECFHGIIKDKLVVNHKNNIKSDNRLENLQLLTSRENRKKDAKKGRKLPPIAVKAINLETAEIFNYKSIYKCSKELCIDCVRICDILYGLNKTTLSKKYNQRFTFEKLLDTKLKIIVKKKVYIKAKIVKINKC